MSEPFQQEAINSGYDADFTCPGCYADLPFDEWNDKTAECPECGRTVSCRTGSDPMSICELGQMSTSED